MTTNGTLFFENDTEEFQSIEKALICAQTAIHKGAENVQILDLTDISSFTEYFVICSGSSNRQVQAISDSIQNILKGEGYRAFCVEGYSDGRWILMDFGDIVIHIFLEALREYYDIESLWMEAPRLRIPSDFYGPAASRLN